MVCQCPLALGFKRHKNRTRIPVLKNIFKNLETLPPSLIRKYGMTVQFCNYKETLQTELL